MPDEEADRPIRPDLISPGDRDADSAGLLINCRSLLDQITGDRMQDEIAGGVDRDRLRPRDRQMDLPRVRAGGDKEVVFQAFGSIAVVFQVDAAVKIVIANAGIRGHVGPPPGRIVADQVVIGARIPLQANGCRQRVGAQPGEPDLGVSDPIRGRIRRGGKVEGGSIGGQEERITVSAAYELNRGILLSEIGDKARRRVDGDRVARAGITGRAVDDDEMVSERGQSWVFELKRDRTGGLTRPELSNVHLKKWLTRE